MGDRTKDKIVADGDTETEEEEEEVGMKQRDSVTQPAYAFKNGVSTRLVDNAEGSIVMAFDDHDDHKSATKAEPSRESQHDSQRPMLSPVSLAPDSKPRS